MADSRVVELQEKAIVVACLFDGSGMATWCVEAAEALAALGQRVCLVHSAALPVHGLSSGVELVPVEPRFVMRPFRPGRIGRECGRVATEPGPFLREASHQLDRRGIVPRAFMLNGSIFFDPAVEVPQFVVAWAYPASFAGYMRKLPTFHKRLFSIDGVRTILDNVGVYRRDWFAYRQAAAIMSVSRRLDAELRASGLRSSVIHPGTRLVAAAPRPRQGPLRLVMMAVDLDVPRKRVPWMLAALRDFPVAAELILIGSGSPQTVALAEATGMAVHVTGRLPRPAAIEMLRSGDVFLFGSMLDDWGYVLLEAMSCGLAVVAADLSPFDEMVGPMGEIYSPFSAESFREAALVACTRGAAPAEVRTDWLSQFSSAAFGRGLLSIMADRPMGST